MNPVASPVAEQKLPGKVGIWIGSLLIVGGIVLGIVLVVAGARSLFDGFDELQRIPINAGGTVTIEEAGEQSVYAERAEGRGGVSFNSSTSSLFRPDIDILVTGPDGQDVTFRYAGGSETYTYDGREGVLIGAFDADQPGDYRIRTILPDGVVPYTDLAVGEGMVLDGVLGILGGVFGGGIVVVIGLVILIISLVRRSGAKRRRTQAIGPYGPGGPYGGGPAGGWAAPPGYAPQPGAYPPAPGYGPGSGAPGWAPPPVPPAPPANEGQSWPPPPPVS